MYNCLSGLGWNLSGGVEGESHSLTETLSFWLVPCAATLMYIGGPTLGEHNGTF